MWVVAWCLCLCVVRFWRWDVEDVWKLLVGLGLVVAWGKFGEFGCRVFIISYGFLLRVVAILSVVVRG